MVALRVFETCFWPAKTKQKPRTFWDAYMSLTWISDIVRYKWRSMATAPLLLHFNDEYRCLGCLNEFFLVFRVWGWSFLVLLFYGNFGKWILKLIWPRLGFFVVFCWNMPRFLHFISALTEISMNCSILVFWRHRIFSKVSLRCNLVCSSYMLVSLSCGIL